MIPLVYPHPPLIVLSAFYRRQLGISSFLTFLYDLTACAHGNFFRANYCVIACLGIVAIIVDKIIVIGRACYLELEITSRQDHGHITIVILDSLTRNHGHDPDLAMPESGSRDGVSKFAE